MHRAPRVLLDGLHFGEGPRWRDGLLWLSDMYGRVVLTVDLDGNARTVVEVPNRPSGLGWLPDGRLLVVSMVDRRLLRLDGDHLVEHADLSGVATFHCNDMAVDAKGRAYVGNFGFDLDTYLETHGVRALFADPGPRRAVLARVDPDGSVHVAATDLRFPNGTVITPDGRTLVVGETLGGRLTAFDVGADGSLSGRRVFAPLGRVTPDGICLDAEGAIWVASPFTSECVRVAEGGEVLNRIPTDRGCYACMLGGPERRHLFLLTSIESAAKRASGVRTGRVEVLEVDVPGAGLP